METLRLGTRGRFAVGFFLSLRAPDPSGLARARSPLLPEPSREGWCSTWVRLQLRADRLPLQDFSERVTLDPALLLRAPTVLPTLFECLEVDREDLDEDDPYEVAAFIELQDAQAVLQVLGYFASALGATYPFAGEEHAALRALVRG